MGQLLAPRAFGSKKRVVLAFVVRPDTLSSIHSCFSFWSGEASRNLGFLRKFFVNYQIESSLRHKHSPRYALILLLVQVQSLCIHVSLHSSVLYRPGM